MKRAAPRARRRRGRLLAGLATFGLLAWLGSGPVVQWLVAREGSRALAMRVTVDRHLGHPDRPANDGGRVHANADPLRREHPLVSEAGRVPQGEALEAEAGPHEPHPGPVDGFVLRVESAGGRTNLDALRGRLHEALGRPPRS